MFKVSEFVVVSFKGIVVVFDYEIVCVCVIDDEEM